MLKILGPVLIVVSSLLSFAGAEELQLDARTLFDRGTNHQLRLNDNGSAIELNRGVLIEDDGPAAGYSYQPNEERLGESIAIRKQLLVADPRAARATLLVGGSGSFSFGVNGEAQTLKDLGKVGNYWQAFELPETTLREGSNDFQLSGKGMIWIARDDEYPAGSRERTRHPNRSAKSRDAGQTWNDKQLGTKDSLDGEYYVRLRLDQHSPQGTLTSHVIDLANLMNQPIGAAARSLRNVKITVAGKNSSATKLVVQYRTSPSPLSSAASWSFWNDLPSSGEFAAPTGRYLQLRAALSTSDPLDSPQLQAIVVQAEIERGDNGLDSWKIVDFNNPPLVRTSLSFEYEPFDHPTLRQIREQYRLDDVVRGAKSELELVSRLAVWSSQQFRHGGHLKTLYPAWNALEILRPHDDGTPVGGFCQQFNLVFLQACESFGIPGRAVSIGPGEQKFAARGGHEVVELWSHEHRKWMYVDGNMAWYAVDRATQVPLSLLELHDRQLDALAGREYPAIEIVTLAKQDRAWTSLTDWPPFVELRMIPRSNFLAVRAPLPLSQGMRGWSWTGHHVWHEARSPAPAIYSQRVTRRGDWEWTLDHVQLWLEVTDTPGTLNVFADTVTPGLKQLERQRDDGEWSVCDSQFEWQLQPGRNRLAVRVRNELGRGGEPAVVEVSR
ncbi:MAG: transglutaminase domain-containing protein [Planctomycetaceae bacterium]|nr:transglutaminase domain-containing protein [Planctomycetaceae bacterium]